MIRTITHDRPPFEPVHQSCEGSQVTTPRIPSQSLWVGFPAAWRDISKIPAGKEVLWSGEFRTDGYFASTVGKHGNEETIGRYIENQDKEYNKLHSDYQLALF
jgi:hypothetical protein